MESNTAISEQEDFNGTEWITNITHNISSSFIIDDSFYDDAYFADVERTIAIVVPVIFGLISVIGLFGNGLVVFVVACYQQMRNTTNLLIINLAVADLLFIVFCVPFTATDYVFPWIFGEIWCRVVQFLIIVCAYASVYTLVLMSLDRFLAVVHPVDSMRIRTEQNALIAIVVMWIVIILCCIPALMAHGLHEYQHNNETYVACTFLSNDHNHPAFQISFFLTSYIIPLTLVCGLYLCMLKRLWHGVAPGSRSSEDNRRKKRATRLVVIVVIIFAMCWGPIQVVLVLKSVQAFGLTLMNIVFQVFSQILAYMNSCVNPILYAFLSENFRKAFRKSICCGVLEEKERKNKENEYELKHLNQSYINNDPETAHTVF